MQFIKIIALAVAAAIVYGICMDNVTARVCVEYFSIGHPHVIDSESPTDLAFVWGVLATWWAGLIIGVPLAFAARAGARPPLAAGDLIRPLGILLAAMALVTLLAGVIGYALASRGVIVLAYPLSAWIAPERHVRFLADGAAHLGAYASGFIGGAVLCAVTWRRRKRASPQQV